MDGTLEQLVESGADAVTVATLACQQILQALNYTAYKGIIHPDVKPENFLYKICLDGTYHFQRADFGLSNRDIDATSTAGSKLYMAPELFNEISQSPKADVWSLFVTILWILDDKFRLMNFRTPSEVWEAISSAASEGRMSSIREMAIMDPTQRASAAQMLVSHFSGDGLSTPGVRS